MADKIIQCGYMSGDTYSAAALLVVDPAMQIILVKDTKGIGQYADKSGLILKIYKESGVEARVTVLDISGSAIRVQDLWRSVSEAFRENTPLPDVSDADALVAYQRQLCDNYPPVHRWPRSITAVTGLLATKWKSNPDETRKALATAWKVGKLPVDQKFALYEYIAQLFGKTGYDIRPNIVVLWSRQSGKRGGAHIELDSSYKAIRQLANEFAVKSTRATVVLAGDERNAKMAHFANSSAHIINATNMWQAPVWARMFGEATFLAQFAFFKFFADEYNVIHIGMRSGMLEAMALLGMTTFYLENIGSGSGSRMLAFSREGIPYVRLEIARPPTVTGRISEQPRLHTMEGLSRTLGGLAAANKRRPGFRANFAGSKIATVDTDWAAKNYAKAKLLDSPLDDRQYDDDPDWYSEEWTQWNQIKRDMDGQRGFSEEDVAKIVDVVSKLFR